MTVREEYASYCRSSVFICRKSNHYQTIINCLVTKGEYKDAPWNQNFVKPYMRIH